MKEDEVPSGGISRRRMLKRIGAGAAIAWTAPVLTSLRMPAFAAVVSGACTAPCPGFAFCGTSSGTDPATNTCHCHDTQESVNECICYNNAQCNSLPDCTASSECPPGWHCIGDNLGCHTNKCGPPCGVIPQAGAGLTEDPPGATVFPIG